VHGGLISVAAVAAARQRALRLWFVGRSAQANGNQSLQQFRTAKPVSASWFSALSDTGARWASGTDHGPLGSRRDWSRACCGQCGCPARDRGWRDL